jgi:hypothetical protein
MIPSCRSREIRSRSSTTTSRWTCSWSLALSIAIPARSANISTMSRSDSLNSVAPRLSVRYRLPTERPWTVTGTPRNEVIGGWFGGNP